MLENTTKPKSQLLLMPLKVVLVLQRVYKVYSQVIKAGLIKLRISLKNFLDRVMTIKDFYKKEGLL